MNQKIENIRVVKLIDNYKILINKGSKDGIKDYMEFLVYEEGEKIIDPLSNQDLGTLEIAKGSFNCYHIQDHMSTLETNEYEIEHTQKLVSFFEYIEKRKKKPIIGIKINDLVKIIN